MAKVKDICIEKINPLIEQMGYEVVEVTYQKTVDGMNLTFFIDCDKGVDINDCEKVSRAIDPILDELNPTDDKPYILSVSSPGIDRPIKTQRDFERNLDKEVEVTLFSKLNGKKVYSGILQNYDNEKISLLIGKESLLLNRKLIANIVPVIKL